MRNLFRFLGVVVCALCIPGYAAGAQWARTYGAESGIARSLQPTADGGYILAGGNDSGYYELADAWIMKLDDGGNIVWQKTFDSGNYDGFYTVYPTADGGCVVAGLTPSRSPGWSDAWIVKLEASGSVEWQKAYRGARGGVPFDIRPTSDGGYIVAGEYGQSSALTHGWVLKLNAEGDLLWQKTYGGIGPAYSYLNVIQTKVSGGYVAAGAIDSSGVWIVELDDVGNIVWQKTYAAPGDEVTVSDLRIATDGGYVVVGTNFPYGADWSEGWILKLDLAGDIVWQKTVGRRYTVSNLSFSSVQPTADGGYLAVGSGTASDRPHYAHASAWKFDASGDLQWQKTYGGQLTDTFNSIHGTADGGHVLLGHTRSFGSGGNSIWVLKWDANEAPLNCINESMATPASIDRVASAANGTATVGSIAVTQWSPSIVPVSTWPVIWQQCPVPLPSSQLIAIEYYHRDFDHYFVTTLNSEIDALDRGVIPGWYRTLNWFRAWGLETDAARVCRFWSGQAFAPKSSHFYTPFATECAEVWKDPHWQYEGQVFAMALPTPAGNCAAGTTPLYRLYNNGMGGAPNHRYTTFPFTRSNMISLGWIPEGIGTGVIGCVPAE